MELTMELPTKLNGHTVIASAPRKGVKGVTAVIVYREAHAHPYVVASWGPVCGKAWSWGHYYNNIIEAVGHFAHMTGQSDVLRSEARA